jgi:hypothetical protein
MKINVYHHVIDDSCTSEVLKIVTLTLEKVLKMSEALDRVTTEVSEIGTVVDSAVALINGLSAQIVALKDDPAKLLALAAELDAKAASLAAAVAANTPVDPTPPTE